MRQLSNSFSLLPADAIAVLPTFTSWYFVVCLSVAASLLAFLVTATVLFTRRLGKLEFQLQNIKSTTTKPTETSKEILLQPITLLPDYTTRKQATQVPSRNSSLIASAPVTFAQLKTIHSAKGTELVDVERAVVMPIGPLGSKSSLTQKSLLLGGLKDLV